MNSNSSRARYALSMRHVAVRRGAFNMDIKALQLRAGEISCVVGANGSGKTSLLLTMLGLLPHDGLCRIDGMYYDGTQPRVKARTGFIPDDPDLLFEELTAREQWAVTSSVVARARSIEKVECMARAESIAAQLSFEPPAKPMRDYSHGMRRKAQIVNALIGKPSVLIVDELRNGLDPIAITQAEQLLRDERDRGAAIMAATHDLWWAERFADYIYVMNNGKIVAEGSCAQLLKSGELHLEAAFYRLIGAGQ